MRQKTVLFTEDLKMVIAMGLGIFFHQNGLIKQTGLYQENKKTGFWKEFNDQGILLSELHYDDGELTNGEIIMLDYKKRKEAEYVFANGKELTKLEYVYGFNGELLCKIFYRNKTEISREIFSYYYSDNTLKSLRTYRAASVDMLSEINNAHDIDDVFEEFGTLHGEYIYYQKDGTVSLKGQFIDGYLEGVLERYYETGELEFKETRTSGWPHGKRERFYLDGTLAEIDEFIYGTLHKNGEPAEGTYEHLFYDDGPIRRTINYVAGIQHGVERIYKLDGSIDAEYFYEYGKIAEK